MMLIAFLNHLWQSTLLVLLAGMLMLLLRKQQARVRYWVWLAASLKFLLPFSWLVAVGSRLAWFRSPASGAVNELYIAIQVVANATSTAMVSGISRIVPALIVVWLAGMLVVMGAWCVRWRRMSIAGRNATPLCDGREVRALRRMERALEMTYLLEMRMSPDSIEPGVFGIVRPILIWPQRISEHLDDAQLEAILAHELVHVRRRDNLASAIHMMVETIFWFYPLVWWLGARLVEERERACDEAVLGLGRERRVYAEGILKVCEFCLASPLASMAGVSGGDLKKRMVSIMTEGKLHKLDIGKKLMLAAAAVATVAGPIGFGILNVTTSRAESSAGVVQESQKAGPEQVSQKEMSGMAVKKVPPEYPAAAKKAGIQGEVKLKAIIGKNGDVENLQVVSGPDELAPAAIEAVKQWKYRPYMKNGQPAEVVTEINVNFTLVK